MPLNLETMATVLVIIGLKIMILQKVKDVL